jgi:hypothetical protein
MKVRVIVKMLNQREAIDKAVEVLKVIYSKDFYYVDNREVKFTNNELKALYEVSGYFDPESDNADTMYSVVEDIMKDYADEDIIKVFFYIELFVEDFYATKVTNFKGRMHIVEDRIDSSVNNLTPNYIKWSRDERKHFYALLSGNYYTNFLE